MPVMDKWRWGYPFSYLQLRLLGALIIEHNGSVKKETLLRVGKIFMQIEDFVCSKSGSEKSQRNIPESDSDFAEVWHRQ